MSYEIIIKQKTTQKVEKTGSWTIIDSRPWTAEELEEATKYKNRDDFLKDNPLKQVYGYTPEHVTIETKEVELLKQTVTVLDLTAVIKAINQIP